MARLDKEKDIAHSEESLSEPGQSKNLKIPDGKTPVYILSPDYADGYVHWLSLPDGSRLRVVCGGGLEGKGFAPTECALCKKTVETYRAAKNSTDKKEAMILKEQGNQMRAKYSAEFIAAKGEILWEKDKSTGKKTPVPDFDEAEVGILNLSQKQYRDLIGLRGSQKYPFIKTGGDLLNRVIILDKGKHEDTPGSSGGFSTVIFIPSKRTSDAPVEFDTKEFDTKADFEIDEDQIKSAVDLLEGEYEEVELEDEDEDEAPKSKKPMKSSSKKQSKKEEENADEANDFEEEFSGEDDFEDDDPEEDFKKQQAKKKKGKK